MIKTGALVLFFAASIAMAALPLKTREGQLVKAESVTTAQLVSVVGSRLEQEGVLPGGAKAATITPADGRKFVVLSFTLDKARSLGFIDYNLVDTADATKIFRAKGLAVGDEQEFSDLAWTVQANGSRPVDGLKNTQDKRLAGLREVQPGTTVRILFEVDSTLQKANLVRAIGDVDQQTRFALAEPIDL